MRRSPQLLFVVQFSGVSSGRCRVSGSRPLRLSVTVGIRPPVRLWHQRVAGTGTPGADLRDEPEPTYQAARGQRSARQPRSRRDYYPSNVDPAPPQRGQPQTQAREVEPQRLVGILLGPEPIL
jgi:hypothetical protein